jgi:hypothetical protein
MILVISRLTFVIASTLAWSPETTRTNVPLVMYLDCLCYRFQHLSCTPANANEPPKNPDVFYIFKMVLGSVKNSYEGRVAKITPGFLDMGTSGMGSAGSASAPASAAAATAAAAGSVMKGHCPVLHDKSLNVFWDKEVLDSTYGSGISPLGYEGSTPATETATATGPGFLYHDLWATMTGSWVDEF